MSCIPLLLQFTASLSLHPSYQETFGGMVLSLLQYCNVQHRNLSRCFENIESKSKEQRVYRFLAKADIDQSEFARATISTFFKKNIKMHIIFDRTNWKFGDTDINFLVLAVRIGHKTFPLFWSMLDHRGNSNTEQRIDLMNKFIEVFGTDRIETFTGDREFIGEEWIQFLCEKNINFCIRFRSNQLVPYGSHDEKPLKLFFDEAKDRTLYKDMYGKKLLFVGKKMPKDETRSEDEYLIVCSNIPRPNKVLDIYKTRWRIEMCFKDLKTAGFNLEETHMKKPERLAKLMCVLTIAMILGLKASVFKKPRSKKTVKCNELSYFNMGLRWIQDRIQELKKPMWETLAVLFDLILEPDKI